MAGTGPKIPTDPVELLTPVPGRPEPYLNQFWSPTICGALGFLAISLSNVAKKRPMFSGVHVHLAATAVAAVGGVYLEEYRKNYLAERDAVLRHYIQLHPEDFVAPEQKKYAEILERWYPIR